MSFNSPALNELKQIPQWVAWRYEDRGGPKPTKPPINPHTGAYASTADPSDWGTFEQAERRARQEGLPGVGFVLSEDDNFTGYDFDGCRNPTTGKIKPWAQQILDLAETYAEASPSGTGIRLIARGKIPAATKYNPAGVEVYGFGRYLTFTGQHIEGTPHTIGTAPKTKNACRARAKLHSETWATLKRAGSNLELIKDESGRRKLIRRDTAAPPPKPGGIISQAVAARGVVVDTLFPKDPFWKTVNSVALQNLPAWVPELFPVATLQATGAWRVSSADLGRDLQEDLSIHPNGIVDWGVDDIGAIGPGQRRAGGHTPIDLVKEYGSHANPTDAALWLCERLGIDPASLGWRGHTGQHEHKLDAGPLPFINIADWDTKPVPGRLWAVEGRIPLKQAYLFTGNGAVGKSLVELMRLVAHILGRPWLGMPVAQGPAIYMGCEDDADELHRRLADILSYYDATFAEAAAKGLHLLSYAGEDCLLGVPEGGIIRPTPLWRRLVEAAMDIRPVAISIDTVADVYGGNEIDRGQVTGFVKMLQGAAIRASCSVGILAHPSVEGMNSGSGISGSTAWHNKVRARAYMRMPEAQKGEEIERDRREIEFKKNNYGPQGDTMQVRWQDGIFVPETASHGLEKVAQDRRDDEFFLRLLTRFNTQGRKVSSIRSANNYAPKDFAEETLEGQKLSKGRLEQAMRRLFAATEIHVEEYGPPSRRHSNLVVTPKGGTC